MEILAARPQPLRVAPSPRGGARSPAAATSAPASIAAAETTTPADAAAPGNASVPASALDGGSRPVHKAAPHRPSTRPAHAGGTHSGSHATSHDSTPNASDLALLAQQAAFDDMVKQRAELEREANALRDLAMAQLKRDDQNMGLWIKLI